MRECLRGWRDWGVKNAGEGEMSRAGKRGFETGNEGVWENLRKESGFLKGCNARYKTKKMRKMGVWSEGREEDLEASVTFLE